MIFIPVTTILHRPKRSGVVGRMINLFSSCLEKEGQRGRGRAMEVVACAEVNTGREKVTIRAEMLGSVDESEKSYEGKTFTDR